MQGLLQEHSMPATIEEALAGNDSLAIMSSADAGSEMLGLNNYEDAKVVQEVSR